MKGIPIVEDYFDPFGIAVKTYTMNEHDGISWGIDKDPSIDQVVIHKWKNVLVTTDLGWQKELDIFRYFINDSTYYQLSLTSQILVDSTMFFGKLSVVDSRTDLFKDYSVEKFKNLNGTELSTFQLDSIRKKWGIR